MSKLKCYFYHDWFNYQHISKSFVNIPKEISKLDINVEAKIGYFGPKKFCERDSQLVCLGSGFIYKYKLIRVLKVICDFLFNRVDIIMLLHISRETVLLALVYKIFFPRKKIYLKLDIDTTFFDYSPSNIALFCIERLLKSCSIISYESRLIEDKLRNSTLFSSSINKLIYLPNCMPRMEQVIPEPSKKEKIIITVGRLGTFQKNTEIVIEALNGLDLNGWRFIFIGSATESVKAKINELEKTNTAVEYVGEVISREEMIEWYKKSSVFLLSSRYEGFATVLVEAAAYGNFIISTNVNGARDVTRNFDFGALVNSSNEIKDTLSDIVSGRMDIDERSRSMQRFVIERFNWPAAIVDSRLLEMIKS
ncbi:glycosyltransferase family 4 protein [Vibrio metschnikovii]|nr:glycosyltransferase family 4 protein [Vibrio metschnikovii]